MCGHLHPGLSSLYPTSGPCIVSRGHADQFMMLPMMLQLGKWELTGNLLALLGKEGAGAGRDCPGGLCPGSSSWGK